MPPMQHSYAAPLVREEPLEKLTVTASMFPSDILGPIYHWRLRASLEDPGEQPFVIIDTEKSPDFQDKTLYIRVRSSSGRTQRGLHELTFQFHRGVTVDSILGILQAYRFERFQLGQNQENMLPSECPDQLEAHYERVKRSNPGMVPDEAGAGIR
ncbi:hypothetical protein H0H93_011201 [Arthromyces matolae]|nr:hypothetical protein H0H93_011201 [Arthromyces matolae]